MNGEFNISDTNIILHLNDPIDDVPDSFACRVLCLMENTFSCHQVVYVSLSHLGRCYLGASGNGQSINVTEIENGVHSDVYIWKHKPIGEGN